mmetsp:Transcript_11095/g.17179  ORF Transcript_11095/g.17179 Transcript_11095/m.17179 type:complete len:192 (+) Transcript_11095:31-606(+)
MYVKGKSHNRRKHNNDSTTSSYAHTELVCTVRRINKSYIDSMTSFHYPSLLFLLAMVMVGSAAAAVDYSGTFTLTTTQQDGTRLALLKEDAQDHVVVVYLTKMDDSNYNLGVKVANSLRAHINVDENNKLEMGPVMSTRMMPPPELREMEDFLSEHLPTLENIYFEDDENHLKLTGPRVELMMKRQQDWES